MDTDIAGKKQELFRVLYAIQQRISSLDAKGLSARIYDHDQVVNLLETVKESSGKESAKLEANLVSITDQTTKDQNLKSGFEKYMKDENKRLKGYMENVSQYASKAKNYVSQIKVKKLKSLISKKNIDDLFRFLFSLLYKKPESEYNSSQFAKIALGSDADDFQIKLASFSTNIFHEKRELAENFKKVKDQQFPESETNVDLNNLLNWMDYIHEMYLAEVE